MVVLGLEMSAFDLESSWTLRGIRCRCAEHYRSVRIRIGLESLLERHEWLPHARAQKELLKTQEAYLLIGGGSRGLEKIASNQVRTGTTRTSGQRVLQGHRILTSCQMRCVSRVRFADGISTKKKENGPGYVREKNELGSTQHEVGGDDSQSWRARSHQGDHFRAKWTVALAGCGCRSASAWLEHADASKVEA